MLTPAEEIRFWTGIMRDHSEFILTSLSFKEQEIIKVSNNYKETFIALHEQSKMLMNLNNPTAISTLVNNCMCVLLNFINFKNLLLKRVLMCNLDTSLPPTFYNHMINEAMEFYKTLCYLQSNAPVNETVENLNLHKIWLPDAAGHAATIAGDLDPVEHTLIKESQEFEKCFKNLALKADELEKMLIRACLENGILKNFNDEVKMKIGEFICFLEKVRKLRLECKAMGVLKPLVPDHMIREENYYLAKVVSYERMTL